MIAWLGVQASGFRGLSSLGIWGFGGLRSDPVQPPSTLTRGDRVPTGVAQELRAQVSGVKGSLRLEKVATRRFSGTWPS